MLWRHHVQVFCRGRAAVWSCQRAHVLRSFSNHTHWWHARVLQKGVRWARSDGSPDKWWTDKGPKVLVWMLLAIETNRTTDNNIQEDHALSVETWHARSSSVDSFPFLIGSPEHPFASSRCSSLIYATVYSFLPTPSSRDQLMWLPAASASRPTEPRCAFGNLCLASCCRTRERITVRKLGWKVAPQVLRWPGTTHSVLPRAT